MTDTVAILAELEKEQFAKIHPTVTAERIVGACERRLSTLDNPGICIACGADNDGCEPDARHYPCEVCGESAVFGAEELLIRLVT